MRTCQKIMIGDAEKISLILKQLLENAIKFTEIGSIEVTASLASG